MAMTIRTTSTQAQWRALRQLAAALALVVLAVALGRPAVAQQIVVMVNGEPITTYDIEQRTKFMQLTAHKTPSRQEVIDDLINEKLKVQIGKRYKLEIGDTDVDNAYADMSRRMRMSSDQLTKALAQGGVDAATLKSKIRADISWQQIVRGKFQSSLQIRDKDVIDKIESSKKEEKEAVGYEYVLRPILFVVPHGSPEAVLDARKREAEALRARFEGCETGLPFARALRDVAVRDQIVKTSADLPQALRKILDETPVGKLTNLEVTVQGVELFALCAKRENKLADVAKREARDELFAEQFQAKAQRYLQELRKGAMIEVK
jgi:peptidyl-prolyl cis-trans isomerase SurA